jgi:hypothetical protein
MGGNGWGANRERSGFDEMIGLLRQFFLKFRELTFCAIEAVQIAINGNQLISSAR